VKAAQAALERGNVNLILPYVSKTAEPERFHQALERRAFDEDDVDAARAYVQAMLGFVVYSHSVYTMLTSSPHEHDLAEGARAEHAGHHR
jgi:hypothetical protein